MKQKTKAELVEEIASLQKTVRTYEALEANRARAESDLLEANMRLSEALTELKRRQQQIIQQARLNALGQMTSGIAHDFNNALMPIQGFSEFLIHNPAILAKTDETVGILRDINEASRHASEMVRRLSGFYRPSEEVEHSLVDVTDLLQSVIALTKPKWKEEMGSRGISIDLQTDFRQTPSISCNETQIREVLTNLILNSVDALPSGGTIMIRCYCDDQWLTIEVSDNGIGMLPEVKERCFEPFFSTKGKGGTGIGLSMVYGIVRGHDGQVTLVSEEDAGTTFTIRLPMEITLTKKAKAPVASGPEPKGLRILIIDDEPWSRDLMEKHLRKNHNQVVATQSGEEGLKHFQQATFDLVITDRAMPDMSGDSVAGKIKMMRPDIPVIMVTGFGEIMKATGETPKGVDAILGKPVTRTELNAAIASVISDETPARV